MENDLVKLKMEFVSDKDYTFFIAILFSLVLEVDDTIPTACTDGRCIKFNTAFWKSLSKPERKFLVLHEVMHVALNHMTRRSHREPKKFNAACDYAINYDLVQAGYSMPKSGLYDEKYKDMTAEAIYDILPDDDSYDEEDIIFSDEAGLAEEIDELLIRAGASAKLADQEAGCIPGSASRRLDELLNPALPWQVIFQDMMLSQAEDDYSMEFPDEEYLPRMYVPTLYSESFGEVSVYCDVSGSVGQKDLDITLAEVNALKNALKPKKITLVSFDTSIHLMKEYDTYGHIDINGIDMNGGGGTCVKEVYEHILTTNPEIAVIVTDGFYSEQELETSANVIYLIMDNQRFTTPNGRVIHINTKDY